MKIRLAYENFWFRNVTFYLLLLSLFLYNEYADKKQDKTPEYIFIELLLILTAIYGAVMFSNVILVRKFLLEKKYFTFFKYFALFWLFYIIVQVQVTQNFGEYISLFNEILGTLFMLFIGTGIYFINLWVLQNVFRTHKKLLNSQAELTFLKQQLNPHFLLNAMNNLYGDALAEPQTVAEKILKLSGLLRYQIEATKKEYVCLTEEIDFVQKYIGYHQYKSHNLKVTEYSEGDFEDFFILPLVFMTLIENAIKFSSECEQPYVDIHWKFMEDHLIFTIENNCLAEGSFLESTGLGLENLRRRLIVSFVKHKITIDKNVIGVFKLELQLWKLNINA